MYRARCSRTPSASPRRGRSQRNRRDSRLPARPRRHPHHVRCPLDGNGWPQPVFSAARSSTARARGDVASRARRYSIGSFLAAAASSSMKLSTMKIVVGGTDSAPPPRENPRRLLANVVDQDELSGHWRCKHGVKSSPCELDASAALLRAQFGNVTETSALLKGPIRGNLSVNPRPFGDGGVIGREFRHAPAPRGGRPPRGSGRPATCAARGRTSDAEPRRLRSICLRPTSAAAAPILRLARGQASAARYRWSGRESHAVAARDHRLYRAPEHAPSKAARSLRR
jgi:hypothetical protein